MTQQTSTEAKSTSEAGSDGFPSSHKIFRTIEHEGTPLMIPMRRIHLAGGEPPLDVYDTSGPQGHAAEEGLPKLREPWIRRREASGTFDGNHPGPSGDGFNINGMIFDFIAKENTPGVPEGANIGLDVTPNTGPLECHSRISGFLPFAGNCGCRQISQLRPS